MSPVGFIERVTSIAQLHQLRAGASRWLADVDADEDTIEIVALILSETCTNALTHGHADVVDVEVTIDDVDDRGHDAKVDGIDVADVAVRGGVVVTVCTRHEDQDPEMLCVPTAMPGPAVTCGRGLAIVDLLVDGMTLRIDPPHVVRRLWLRTGGESTTT
jgi:anti-sigma regulatory factor (Ser/Thr protein kinase)